MEIVQEKSALTIHINNRRITCQKSLLHWHHNVEICQVLENKMCFLVNGVLVEANEGDVIFIGENVVHQFQIPYGPSQVYIMQFPLKLLMEAGIPIKRCKMHVTAQEMERIPGLKERICTLFETIEAEKYAMPGEENYFQRSMVAALYCLLTRHFAEEGKEEVSKEQKEFIHILEYIGEHFEEDINVNILAERLFMYRGRLASLFKKYSGMSLNEYVYSLRIKKANELMDRGGSVIEAAMQSGFQSVRTFNHVYKKITGITPTAYKKRSAGAMLPL